jgi:hypothetical protein
MKKTIFGIVAILLLANISNQQMIKAQDVIVDTREVPHFGFKVGTNLSNVYDSQAESFNADSKFGLVAGGFISIPLGKFLGIQPEVLYSQKGFQASGTIPILGFYYKYTQTLTYIDVPIQLRLKPAKMLSILAGPVYSYLLNVQNDYSTGSTSFDFKNDNIRKNTLGFLGGLDINVDHLVIGARVGWDILDNDGDGTTSNPRYKNVWYQATLGYSF